MAAIVVTVKGRHDIVGEMVLTWLGLFGVLKDSVPWSVEVHY